MSKDLDLLSICLQTPNCLPPLLWGEPGVGKTSEVVAYTSAVDWDCEVLRPAERGEGALGVVPVPSEDRAVLHYPLPDWAQRLAKSERPGLVFLDEVSSTPPALQPAIMGLALDGVIAGQRLPARVKRCAAANPVDQAAGGWELAPALANRFVHLEWKCPEVSAWTNWLIGQTGGALGVVIDPVAWESQWTQARALGAAFLRSHPVCLHEGAAKVIGRALPAFATPRTWEAALRLLASCRATERMDLYPALAEGCLGEAVAMKGAGVDAGGAWLVWLRDNDLPDPEELLKDPSKFHHDPKRPDRTFAIFFAVAEASLATVNGKKLSEKERGDRWRAGWSVLRRGLDMKLGKDIVLLPAKVMANPQRRPKAPAGEDGKAVHVVLSDFIDLYHA